MTKPCTNCHVNPVTGNRKYCGSKCRTDAANKLRRDKRVPYSAPCVQCHDRMVFRNRKYCGAECARIAKAAMVRVRYDFDRQRALKLAASVGRHGLRVWSATKPC